MNTGLKVGHKIAIENGSSGYHKKKEKEKEKKMRKSEEYRKERHQLAWKHMGHGNKKYRGNGQNIRRISSFYDGLLVWAQSTIFFNEAIEKK